MLGGGSLAVKRMASGTALATPVGLGLTAHHRFLADCFDFSGECAAWASSDAVSGERPFDLSNAAHDLAERPSHFGGAAGRVVRSAVIGNGSGTGAEFPFLATEDAFVAGTVGEALAGEDSTARVSAVSNLVAGAGRLPKSAER